MGVPINMWHTHERLTGVLTRVLAEWPCPGQSKMRGQDCHQAQS